MPLTATGDAAWDTMKAAGNAARDAYLAGKDLPLSPAQVEEMVDAMRAAELDALFAHFLANATVVGTATGAVAGGPGVPIVGTIL